MPNILAHTHITTSVFSGRERDIVLGSTLPDFAGIHKALHGENVPIRGLSVQIDLGIDFHHTTDSFFGAQPEVPEMTVPLWTDLTEAGLEVRAARASATMAADILLDAALLEFDEPRQNFRRARNAVITERTEVLMHHDKRFRDIVTAFFAFNRPYVYQNSRTVAEIIARRLATRQDPREAVLPEQRGTLADVLSLHAERIGGLGLSATSATIEYLSTY
ncbi:hypothetical protein HYW35_00955 [Candidatus Saccharibacteria bacterium]|nr:hypothetical protein [Candidatus Saccharibacteria bacterium]